MNRRDRRQRLNDIQHVADTLRSDPIEVPDFTRSILDRVDAERPFLAPSVRRRLPWVRIGLGGCAALAVLATALTYRWAPRTVRLADQPAPISDVVQCVECAATRKLIALRPSQLTITDTDATRLIAAVATAAKLSEGEGRSFVVAPAVTSTAMSGGFDPVVLTPLATPSQDVPLALAAEGRPLPMNAPESPVTRVMPRFAAAAFPAQSTLAGTGPHGMYFSGELPKAKVVPSFLEHDLDGVVLPR